MSIKVTCVLRVAEPLITSDSRRVGEHRLGSRPTRSDNLPETPHSGIHPARRHQQQPQGDLRPQNAKTAQSVHCPAVLIEATTPPAAFPSRYTP